MKTRLTSSSNYTVGTKNEKMTNPEVSNQGILISESTSDSELYALNVLDGYKIVLVPKDKLVQKQYGDTVYYMCPNEYVLATIEEVEDDE